MSYILQALRKAAQARGDAHNNPGFHLVRADTRRRREWPRVAVVAILVLGGGLYWAGLNGMLPAGQATLTPAAPKTTFRPPEPGPPATATLTPPPAPHRGPAASAIPAAPAAVEPPTAGDPPGTAPPPAVTASRTTPPKTAVSAPPGDAAQPAADPKGLAPADTPPTVAPPPAREAVTPQQPPAGPEVILDTKLLEDLAAPGPSPAGPPLPERPEHGVDPAVTGLLLFEQMPSAVQAVVPDIRITLMAYSEVPADRIVYIKKQRYVQGDMVEGQFRIEQISRSGVVLSYQGQRFLLTP
ncbi:MAG: general secretion pathway protein GspB [Gammaproteobacteria bacterium]